MIDIAKLVQKLKDFDDGEKASQSKRFLWKPKEGEQKVRIVPYSFTPDMPFIELKFYYNIGDTHYLAPCTFGKPDPILEYIETLRNSGSQTQAQIAREISPQSRYYVPIIVRGEEDQGVKFWGFSVTVYKKLMELMIDTENWGDITSLTEGNDIKVVFKKVSNKKNVKTGKPFPETTISPVPKKTPAVDPTKPELLEKIQNQVNINDLFPLKSYEELKAIADRFFNPPTESASASATPAAVDAPAEGAKLGEEFDTFFAKPA
jgi:hypothetical protein